MRSSLNTVRVLVIVLVLIVPSAVMAGGLDDFLADVDVRASADIGSFKADLRVTFGASDGKIDGVFEVVSKPSDVYMCLRIGELAKQPVDVVVDEYKQHKGQGWGVIAKNLGIKPGSEEFHALKAGRLPVRTASVSTDKKDKGGKGKK
jgi:hypothetical protein